MLASQLHGCSWQGVSFLAATVDALHPSTDEGGGWPLLRNCSFAGLEQRPKFVLEAVMFITMRGEYNIVGSSAITIRLVFEQCVINIRV